ncbi:MAG: hypothetical protein ABI690_04715 [Chloroflexota bacterium]
MTYPLAIPSRKYIKWIAFLLVGLLCMIPILLYLPILLTPAPVLTTYSGASVQKICSVFAINPQDEFCLNPQSQNASTFENMLNRNFPVGKTQYDDIMSHFEVVLAAPSYEKIESTGEFAKGFCPPLQERGNEFSCTILFSTEINPTYIYFENSTGNIMKIGVPRPKRT